MAQVVGATKRARAAEIVGDRARNVRPINMPNAVRAPVGEDERLTVEHAKQVALDAPMIVARPVHHRHPKRRERQVARSEERVFGIAFVDTVVVFAELFGILRPIDQWAEVVALFGRPLRVQTDQIHLARTDEDIVRPICAERFDHLFGVVTDKADEIDDRIEVAAARFEETAERPLGAIAVHAFDTITERI